MESMTANLRAPESNERHKSLSVTDPGDTLSGTSRGRPAEIVRLSTRACNCIDIRHVCVEGDFDERRKITLLITSCKILEGSGKKWKIISNFVPCV